MAGFNDKNQEHAFQKFQRDIKDERLENLVIFCGIEEYLMRWATDMLVDKYVNPVTKTLDCDYINLETAQIDDVIASCETAPMMSPRKTVIIKEYKNEFVKELSEYAKDMPESTLLVVAGNDVDKALKAVGQVYDFEPLKQPQLISFINKRFKAAGKEAGKSIITTLINESGYYNKDIDYGLYNLEGDIKKIIALSDGDTITLENVRKGISDNLEHGVFSLIDAISNNRKDVAFTLLHQLLLSGEKEFSLLAMIISQLEIMLQSKELAEDGNQLSDMKKAIKVHEFRIKKALNFARKYSTKDLKRMLKLAYATDGKIKMGILEGNLALEMLIAEI